MGIQPDPSASFSLTASTPSFDSHFRRCEQKDPVYTLQRTLDEILHGEKNIESQDIALIKRLRLLVLINRFILFRDQFNWYYLRVDK